MFESTDNPGVKRGSKQIRISFYGLIQSNALGQRTGLHLGPIHFTDRRQELALFLHVLTF
jgi:hypothetical protein